MEILLLRHGVTAGNLRRAYIGRTDEPLAPAGWKQVQALAKAVPQVERVYGSPLRRCRETADIFYPHLAYREVPGLVECDFGAFEGKTYQELKGDPAYRCWLDSGGEGAIPGGESAPVFRRRCAEAFAQLVEEAAREGVSSCAVVCHGGSIMAILARYSGEPDFYRWQVGNAAGYKLVWEETAWRNEQRVRVTGLFPPAEG